MRITSKGQVTIPIDVRERAGLMPGSDVDFVVEGATVRLVKGKPGKRKTRIDEAIDAFRGSATTRLSTEELMKLLRGWDEEPPGVLD